MHVSMDQLKADWGIELRFVVNPEHPQLIESLLCSKQHSLALTMHSDLYLASAEAYDSFRQHHANKASKLGQEFKRLKAPLLRILLNLRNYINFVSGCKKEIALHKGLSVITFDEFKSTHMQTPKANDTLVFPTYFTPGDTVYELNIESFVRSGHATLNVHRITQMNIELELDAFQIGHYSTNAAATFMTSRGLSIELRSHSQVNGDVVSIDADRRIYRSMDALKRGWEQLYKNPVIHINDSSKSKFQKFYLQDWLKNENPTDLMPEPVVKASKYDWDSAFDNAQTQIDEWENRPQQDRA